MRARPVPKIGTSSTTVVPIGTGRALHPKLGLTFIDKVTIEMVSKAFGKRFWQLYLFYLIILRVKNEINFQTVDGLDSKTAFEGRPRT